MGSAEWLASLVVDVADFPKPGIVFKDITPLLADPDGLRLAVEVLADPFVGGDIDTVVGVDARGFIFGAPMAYRLGAAFVPVRKAGKLPRPTRSQGYSLEYGDDHLEVHRDDLTADKRVVLVDDVLATGGTAAAAASLIQQSGASLAGAAFLIELGDLGGRARMAEVAPGVDPHVLLQY